MLFDKGETAPMIPTILLAALLGGLEPNSNAEVITPVPVAATEWVAAPCVRHPCDRSGSFDYRQRYQYPWWSRTRLTPEEATRWWVRPAAPSIIDAPQAAPQPAPR